MTAGKRDESNGRRYLLLLLTLVSSFFLTTLTRIGFPARVAIGLVSLALTFTMLRSIWGQRRIFLTAMILGTGFLLSVIGEIAVPTPSLQVVSDVMIAGFLATVGATIALDVGRSTRVTMDTLYGAACLYFMLGLFFAALYRLVYWSDPQAFNLPAADAAAGTDAPAPAWFGYYSMITLTTIGYGDITPASSLARSLAMLEGLTGQLYLAITIARLVALQTAEGLRSKRSP